MAEPITAGPSGEPGASRRRGDRLRSVLAWTVVGSWGVWATARLAGLDGLPAAGAPMVALLSFTPYVTAVAPIPIICAVALRRWWAASVAVVVAAGLVVAVVPRAFGSGQPAATGPALRMLSSNLQFGQGDAATLVELVRRTGTDVLSVQELTPAAVRRLERAGLKRLLPHRVLDDRDGTTGIGIYSRHPLRALPPVAGTTYTMPRAELTLPGGVTAEVTAVHPLPPLSGAMARKWNHDLAALPAADRDGPAKVVAGDFNATLDHARFRSILDRGYADAADRVGKGLVPTWGTERREPALTIDHVLVSRQVAVRRVEVFSVPGSDHRALFADLRLPGS
ncbi:endonuclease/exonuclease/phosphatase family protein [Actinomadura sp. HBU206391]|uniref:endonuclease/exonuclease/phosphatase family protein n=1 Tax=Actinomadura sp. HBU206391 TaxID=2731692 RepID=UPI00165096C0|nr:endonuclease/exonuclease/phosphatase family protein [Actinomadura sp. HBU206391]MBC6461690.1 endonuclease/exonuclease/phosphatase family protein [Actinomadura sp. HBU206391]